MRRSLCLLLVLGGALAHNVTEEEEEDKDYSWSSSNVKIAIGISIGAGLATGVGGAVAFVPSLLEKVSPAVVLSVSLSLSAGVMLYVSFIEIFVKAHDAILEDNGDEFAAAALTTFFFFLGMFCCYLLELLVHRLDKSHTIDHTAGAPSPPTTRTVDVEGGGDEGGNQTATKAAADGRTAAFFSTMDGCGHDHGSGASNVKMDDAEKVALGKMGMLTGVAIAIHNLPEGLATFLATVSDTSVGAALGTAIAIHNIPEGICVAMPIYCAWPKSNLRGAPARPPAPLPKMISPLRPRRATDATGNKWKAFFWATMSGVTEPIGGIIGYAILQPVFTDMVYGCVFAMVGGMMVFIVLHELLPTAHRYMPGRGGVVTAMLVLGMVIMSMSLVLFTL